MRAGFLASDRNITVSPNYAREITTSPDRGVELDTVIRERGIEGIVNGVCNNVSTLIAVGGGFQYHLFAFLLSLSPWWVFVFVCNHVPYRLVVPLAVVVQAKWPFAPRSYHYDVCKCHYTVTVQARRAYVCRYGRV